MLQIDICFDIAKFFKNLKQCKFCIVTADEVTDVTNYEQLVICISWTDQNFEPHGDRTGF